MQVRKLRSREYCQELKKVQLGAPKGKANSSIEVSSLESRRFAPDTLGHHPSDIIHRLVEFAAVGATRGAFGELARGYLTALTILDGDGLDGGGGGQGEGTLIQGALGTGG